MAGGSRSSRKGALLPGHVARVVEPQDAKASESGVSPARTVLIVGPDSATGGEIVGALQRRGFPALLGATVPLALYWARRQPPALVILDARLPDWSRLVREFRQKGRPVLALTDDKDVREAALDEGCLDSPLTGLDPDALAQRAEILLGRGWVIEAGRIAAGPLVVDLSGGELHWRGQLIPITPLLLRLAAYLAAHAGQIVPSNVLLEEVWGEPWADPNKVHQALWRLRRLLGEPANSSFLVGRQRHGYAFMPDATPITSRQRASGF